MIRMENIAKRYTGGRQSVEVLNGIDATFPAGTFSAVCGPSGSGKSTLLLIMGGLLRPDSGVLALGETQPWTLSNAERARFRGQQVGFVFQRFHLLPYLSVEDNIRAAAVGTGSKEDRTRAGDLMERFHLTHRTGHIPGRLSVGERQRVALARALYNHPTLLLADEPTGNLDPDNVDIVLQAFRSFADDGGTVIMVTHGRDAAAHADTVWHIRDGRLIPDAA